LTAATTIATTALSTASTALTTANYALSESNAQVTALAGSGGTQAMDAGDAQTLVAANAHADAGDAATLSSANAHADAGDATTLAAANSFTTNAVSALNDSFTNFENHINQQLDIQDKRISKMGAMSAAMVQAGINSVGSHSANGRLSIGAGFQSGQSAISIGWGRPIGEHASFSLGGAFSNGESSAGIGFGVDL
jgi:hypothetical protein